MFKEKYISKLSTIFVGSTHNNGRINLGVCSTNRITSLHCWAQYFSRLSEYPTIVDMKGDIFIQYLDTKMSREDNIKNPIGEFDNKAKEEFLGPLGSDTRNGSSGSQIPSITLLQ